MLAFLKKMFWIRIMKHEKKKKKKKKILHELNAINL